MLFPPEGQPDTDLLAERRNQSQAGATLERETPIDPPTCEQTGKHDCLSGMSLAVIRPAPAVELNPAQKLAVEHGIGDKAGPGPLLVIAGAGSGKTAMLAHRVAALVLAGADPKRIMLATFSRRAAAELGRRVERLLARRLTPEAAAAAAP